MGEAGTAFAVTNGSLLLVIAIDYATKHIEISLHYEFYNYFDRVNNNGSLVKAVGQIGVHLA